MPRLAAECEVNMICKSCGRTIEKENANFCDYCGSSLREQRMEDFYKADTQNVSTAGNNAAGSNTAAATEEKPITFRNWMGSMLLPFIPIFGWLIYLIALLYWSFSGKVTNSKKNWARATLIIVIISFILLIFYFDMMFQQLAANGIDINSFVQQLYSIQ